MRKLLVVTLAVVALIGTMAPGVFAQPAAAPAAPPLTFNINGFLDTISSASWNLRDANFTRTGDKEWYARNRGRINIEGRAGTAVFVWGIEIDTTWGQTSGTDNNLAGQVVGNNQQRSGTTSGFDLNTDVQASVETKWLFAEFDAPLLPFATRVRVGAQPYSVTYKICALACSDFAGVNLVTTWSPNVKSHLTFAQIEEELTGPSTGGTGLTGFNRGDDFAFIAQRRDHPVQGPRYPSDLFVRLAPGRDERGRSLRCQRRCQRRHYHSRLPPRRWLLPGGCYVRSRGGDPGGPDQRGAPAHHWC